MPTTFTTPLEIHADRLAHAARRVSAWICNNESPPPEDLTLELIVEANRVQRILAGQVKRREAA